MAAGLREDWISDMTLAVVIPFGKRGGKARCEQWDIDIDIDRDIDKDIDIDIDVDVDIDIDIDII